MPVSHSVHINTAFTLYILYVYIAVPLVFVRFMIGG